MSATSEWTRHLRNHIWLDGAEFLHQSFGNALSEAVYDAL
jgi:hypothetical protein